MAKTELKVDGKARAVVSAPDTPLLYVLTDELDCRGPRFGCGLAQCGSCSVLIDGVETRACVTPLSAVGGKAVTTLEGLPAWHKGRGGKLTRGGLHPIQQALVDEQAIQCGYCYNGVIIKAAELLSKTPKPTEAQIRQAMNGHLCRCGTYPRILKAIQRAAKVMTGVTA
jgi:aerobic-type carbon monoxide dehydrogenase small subunit (CoxS/CutS family)